MLVSRAHVSLAREIASYFKLEKTLFADIPCYPALRVAAGLSNGAASGCHKFFFEISRITAYITISKHEGNDGIRRISACVYLVEQ